jgi:broad specificity phosphatase PhoE
MQDASAYGRRLVLVRHGESGWNALGLVQGQAAAPGLTERGRREAVKVARQLQQHPVDMVVSSDLLRARQTAEIIAERIGCALTLDSRLRERNFGVLEGGSWRNLTPALTGIVEERVADADARPSGGESIRALYARVGAFVESVREGGAGEVVAVCHGGALRVASAYAMGVSPDDMAWTAVGNADRIVIELTTNTDHHDPAVVGPLVPTKGGTT